MSEICKDGHSNQAGGCCCPVHGNTCGYHPEYDKPYIPEGFSTLAEYIEARQSKKTQKEKQKSEKGAKNEF